MRLFPALVLVVLLTLLPSVVRGQSSEFPQIEVGATLDAFLSTSTPTLGGRGSFNVYRFDAEAGVRYGVDLRSFDFDAYLILARPVGGITEFLREDDEGGGDGDARLRFSVDEAGTYLLIVQAYDERTGGAFTLSLEERDLPPPQPPRPIALGATVEGRIDASSSILIEYDEEISHDLWTFEGRGGENVLIALDADEFDPYLEFGALSAGELIVSHSDDDGGGNLNALLRVELPHDGTFGIRARAYGEGEFGAYTLALRPFTPAPALRRPIAVGERVEAELTVEDAIDESGIHFQEWVLQGEVGTRLRISMRSESLDSYLILGDEREGGRFGQIIFNDDGPDGGFDAQIDYTLPRTGTFILRARTYGGGERGAYTLEVEPLP